MSLTVFFQSCLLHTPHSQTLLQLYSPALKHSPTKHVKINHYMFHVTTNYTPPLHHPLQINTIGYRLSILNPYVNSPVNSTSLTLIFQALYFHTSLFTLFYEFFYPCFLFSPQTYSHLYVILVKSKLNHVPT